MITVLGHRRTCVCLLGCCGVLMSFTANAAEKAVGFPKSILGYYVMGSVIEDGAQCKKDGWSDRPETSADNSADEAPRVQLRVSDKDWNYHGAGANVICRVLKVSRPTNKNPIPGYEFVGPWLRPSEPVYKVDVECFDEGTVGRHTIMARSVEVGNKKMLLETDLRSGVTEVWAACEMD